jgi:NTP pyrophosphatase (non-canonical NTP hydrolase)
MMEIKELIKEAHENAVKHGFWEDLDKEGCSLEWHRISFKNPVCNVDVNAISTRLMLIVGEVAEAQEGLRHNDRENFKEELADVAIRLADLCGGLGIDLEAEIHKKMEKNKDRPYKHGKAF